jgi:hypothetical protein
MSKSASVNWRRFLTNSIICCPRSFTNVVNRRYLRPAAALAGVLSLEKNPEGEAVVKAGKVVENDPRRFGFYNLRHGLASLLVTDKITDAKTTSEMLRYSDVKTTLALYTHSTNDQRVAAQGKVLKQFMGESQGCKLSPKRNLGSILGHFEEWANLAIIRKSLRNGGQGRNRTAAASLFRAGLRRSYSQ